MFRVVLLVDDDALVRAVAALMLEDLGCEVVTAAGGRHAMDSSWPTTGSKSLITDVTCRTWTVLPWRKRPHGMRTN